MFDTFFDSDLIIIIFSLGTASPYTTKKYLDLHMNLFSKPYIEEKIRFMLYLFLVTICYCPLLHEINHLGQECLYYCLQYRFRWMVSFSKNIYRNIKILCILWNIAQCTNWPIALKSVVWYISQNYLKKFKKSGNYIVRIRIRNPENLRPIFFLYIYLRTFFQKQTFL